MKNPYEQVPEFAKSFPFTCEGKSYVVATGSTDTAEGRKYRISIRSTDSNSTNTPIFEYSGINAEELKEISDFLQGAIGFNDMTLQEIVSHLQNLIIDRHAESGR